MKLFVTGASGLLGSNLCYLLKDSFEVEGIYLHHPVVIPRCKTFKLDILDESALHVGLLASKPDVIIHTAANASVDECEKHPEQAHAINAFASESIARTAKQIGAKMIYISTDSVFTENREKAFTEEEKTEPRSVYAKTKLEGEKRVLKILKDALIVRTCIYGFNTIQKMSLGEWVLNSLSKHEPVQGFADIYFTPILVNDLVDGLEQAIKLNLSGVFHIASRDHVSKYDFACLVADEFGFSRELITKSGIGNSKLEAFRPPRPCLDVSKYEKKTGFQLPTVKEGIEYFHSLYEKNYHEQIRSFTKKLVKQEK